jgi:hypothetical protein
MAAACLGAPRWYHVRGARDSGCAGVTQKRQDGELQVEDRTRYPLSGWAASAPNNPTSEAQGLLYTLRLAGFVLLIVAIVSKNMDRFGNRPGGD